MFVPQVYSEGKKSFISKGKRILLHLISVKSLKYTDLPTYMTSLLQVLATKDIVSFLSSPPPLNQIYPLNKRGPSALP